MLEDERVTLGPFENIRHCPNCDWVPTRWSGGHVYAYLKFNEQQLLKICPECGSKTEYRVGRYVYPVVHTPWLHRLFIGPYPVKGQVRWKEEGKEDGHHHAT